MLQQSLKDALKFDAQSLEAPKKSLAGAKSELTTDTAGLKMTEDALAEDTAELADATRDCQVKAAELETATESRSEELVALAKARTMISEQTSGAQSFSYVSPILRFYSCLGEGFHCAEVWPNSRLCGRCENSRRPSVRFGWRS